MKFINIGLVLFLFITLPACPNPVTGIDSFLEIFSSPPAEYSSSPFWVWNDDIQETDIDRQLAMFADQKIFQVFVHPRPGLVTNYLSERWLDLWDHALQQAKNRGILIHLYDENSYPSGFAGGHVPAQMPDAVFTGIRLVTGDLVPQPLPENTLAAYRKEKDVYVLIPDISNATEGIVAAILIEKQGASDWFGGFPYVDLLYPGVTNTFLSLTLDPYIRKVGQEFGKQIRACFTDEPHLISGGGKQHWTPDFAQVFQERYGYDLIPSLPSLFIDMGDYRKVRFDYYQLLLDLFIERWARPYRDHCAELGLDFTGHYWEHEWPKPDICPDNMALASYQQMPGIDCLGNSYDEGVNSQLGNIRAVREVASIANQLGCQRALCEVYGGAGWELTFEDQKRIADWLGVHGINFFNQHLSFVSLRGARKRDYPPTFSDHEPWWNHYHVLADYLTRLSYALSSGEEQNRILVLEPTTSGWLHFASQNDPSNLQSMGEEFQSFLVQLSLNQVPYDLASERVLREHAKIMGDRFVVGERAYDLVILHQTCQNLTSTTFDLLKNYYRGQGKILVVGERPQFVDGRSHPELDKLTQTRSADIYQVGGATQPVRYNSLNDLLPVLRKNFTAVEFTRFQGGKLFHQTRQLDQGQLLFLTNTSKEEAATGSWVARGKNVTRLDLFTGQHIPIRSVIHSTTLEVSFDLASTESSLYLIHDQPLQNPPDPMAETSHDSLWTPVPVQLTKVERLDPNVLTIDFANLQVDGQTLLDRFLPTAQQELFKARGFHANPWHHAIQYQDRILRRDADYSDGSGFNLTYSFTISRFETLPTLSAVIEQAHLYQVTLNGQPLEIGRETWLDPRFSLVSLPVTHLKQGENQIALSTTRFSVQHEIEPIYILGDFSLSATDKGFEIIPPQPLTLGAWKDQGLDLYPARVRYTYQPAAPVQASQLKLHLTDWRGTVVEVHLNGQSAGLIGWRPDQILAPLPKSGLNELAFDVYGSLQNQMGPHHTGELPGIIGPGQYTHGPESGPPAGKSYYTRPYGLMKDPVVSSSSQ